MTVDGADDVLEDVAGLTVAAALVGLALPAGDVPLPEQEIIPGIINNEKIHREMSFFILYPPRTESLCLGTAQVGYAWLREVTIFNVLSNHPVTLWRERIHLSGKGVWVFEAENATIILVREEFGVATPVDGGLQLSFSLLLTKVSL